MSSLNYKQESETDKIIFNSDSGIIYGSANWNVLKLNIQAEILQNVQSPDCFPSQNRYSHYSNIGDLNIHTLIPHHIS